MTAPRLHAPDGRHTPRSALTGPARTMPPPPADEDARTLTFTVPQLVEMLLVARFAEPPASVNLARREIEIQANAEWHRQQSASKEPPCRCIPRLTHGTD